MQDFFDKISQIMDWIYETIMKIVYWILSPLYEIGKSILQWGFDKLCDLVEFLVSAVDFKNETFENALNSAGLPEQLSYILNAVGMDNCLLILVTAIGIRLTLNLIPAALTRI
jgi:maltodextrin utilization protein YvdJ